MKPPPSSAERRSVAGGAEKQWEATENLLRFALASGEFSSARELIDKQARDSLEDREQNQLELYDILTDRGQRLCNDKTTCERLESLLDKLLDNSDDGNEADFVELTALQLAAILWDNNQYERLENLLLRLDTSISATGRESLRRRIWLAHTIFMQDTRYEECCHLYEKLLTTELLASDPIVLANLCVSYLLTGKNETAETLLKQLESEEASDLSSRLDTAQKVGDSRESPRLLSHSIIVNLIIGQLYCVKLNFNFGLTRIFKTLEPLDELLSSETWLICKQCILSLIDNHCKCMIFVGEDLFEQVISFLIDCEQRANIAIRPAPSYKLSANLESKLDERDKSILWGRNSVSYEARYLRSLIVAVLHD